ncbi:MAG: hypothetical protein KGH98_01330 [Candidatus Micrarchaeota archaeon]|nr:hypothetical protein [Candidatus Micrarchaeota archaeon]
MGKYPGNNRKQKADLFGKLAALSGSRYGVLTLAFLILLGNVFVRLGPLSHGTLYEPDGYYYYSVIQQTIANHFVVPAIDALSGFPNHIARAEQPGLIYVTVLPYMLLSWTGITPLQMMEFIPVAFGVLQSILAFFLVKQLSDSNKLGLLAMFFTSISAGAAGRTAATTYRGDSFISIFLMAALLLLVMAYREKRTAPKIAKYALSGVVLGLGYLVWTGSPFTVAVYLLAVALMAMWGFIRADRKILKESLLALGALFISYVLDIAFLFTGFSRRELPLQGPEFFLFFVPLLAFSFLGLRPWGMSQKRIKATKFLESKPARAALVAALVAVFAIIAYLGFGSQIGQIISVNAPIPGNQTTIAITQALLHTIQEQQLPGFNLFFGSFNMQIYFAPIGVLLFALLAYMIDGSKWKGIGANISVPFIAMASYLAITAYLQFSAVRFNALLAVPLGIFAAYGVYAIGKLVHDRTIDGRPTIILLTAALIMFSAFILSVQVYPMLLFTTAPVIILSGAVTAIAALTMSAYSVYASVKGRMAIRYVYYSIIAVLMAMNFYIVWGQSYTLYPVDNINPEFLGALSWMANNTPSNSTVLTFWPDGSIVEAMAHRQSYLDSVGGQNATRIYMMARFLFNSTPDLQFLKKAGKPDYILARTTWFGGTGSIEEEGLINSTDYIFIPVFAHVSINRTAQNETEYRFDSGAPSNLTAMLITRSLGSSSGVLGLVGPENSGKLAALKHVMLYNISSSEYTMVNSTLNNTLGYTLMVSYTGDVIVNATIVSPQMLQTNIFKLALLCNNSSCPYNQPGSGVTATPVYISSDAKIYRMNYSG